MTRLVPGRRRPAGQVGFELREAPPASIDERLFGMILAYFGPEMMMPVVSVIAVALGVVMMFNRNILLYGRGLVERVRPHPRRR